MEAVIEAGGRSNPALNRRGTALVSTDVLVGRGPPN